MKFLLFARLRVGATWPDDALTLFQQTIDWINGRLTDGTFDCTYNLPAGGGLAIVNAASHETLTDILSSYPLEPWVQYEVHPLSDIKHAFELTIKTLSG